MPISPRKDTIYPKLDIVITEEHLQKVINIASRIRIKLDDKYYLTGVVESYIGIELIGCFEKFQEKLYLAQNFLQYIDIRNYRGEAVFELDDNQEDEKERLIRVYNLKPKREESSWMKYEESIEYNKKLSKAESNIITKKTGFLK